MELQATETDALTTYLDYYAPLIGDQQTAGVFRGMVKGSSGRRAWYVPTLRAVHSAGWAAP